MSQKEPTSAPKAVEGGQRSATFPMGAEVLQRIHWDPRLEASRFVVGYEDRHQGMCELPASEFPLRGEIPLHRVRRVRIGAVVVWDRDERIDRMAEIHDIQAELDTTQEQAYQAYPTPRRKVRGQKPLTKASFERHQVYRYTHGEGWIPAVSSVCQELPGRLRICTYNVLFDLFGQERLHTTLRYPALLRQLQESNADIIGLQEVTHGFLEALVACPWVQEQYFVTELPGGATISPFGQVLLSRYPLRETWVLSHSEQKRSLVVQLDTSPFVLGLVLVHLTSNRRIQAKSRREEQMQQIHEAIQSEELAQVTRWGAGEWLILGDFNTRSDELQHVFDALDLVDIWECMYGTEEGYTFVPAVNPLARLASTSQLPGRFDRILLHTPKNRLFPCDIQMIGTSPVAHVDELGPLYPSDHFGLRCTLQCLRDSGHDHQS